MQRITVTNLLNTITGFPPEIRDDPWGRSYTLALAVVKHFLGTDWIETHLQPINGAQGFLQPSPDAPSPNLHVQFFRTVDLGELLFNLQTIEGFDGCVDRLRTESIESVLAELDVARMLYINDHQFQFIKPSGQTGNDYDFKVNFTDGRIACVEAKCNLETQEVNLNTIKNALDKARSQLPKDQPGIIFVKLPSLWLDQVDFQRQSIELAQTFLRATGRIVSVNYYVASFDFRDGMMWQGHRFKETPNPANRFDVSRSWALLTNWVPDQTSWNKMPPKWTRLVFFPEKQPPTEIVVPPL